MAKKGEQFGLSKCRGCGKDIVWAKTPEGKNIPLDPRPATYMVCVDSDDPSRNCAMKTGEDALVVYVSHFATCTHANDFTSAKPIPKGMH